MLFHCQPAEGEDKCQSKVMVIQLTQKAEVGFTCDSQLLPQIDEKMICLLVPESNMKLASESTPQTSKENILL